MPRRAAAAVAALPDGKAIFGAPVTQHVSIYFCRQSTAREKSAVAHIRAVRREPVEN
jgi:hypothetical protein